VLIPWSVKIDLCFCGDFAECFEDALEGVFDDDLAETFDDDLDESFKDDLDECWEVSECFLAELEAPDPLSVKDWDDL
jgi:hypothetical protein